MLQASRSSDMESGLGSYGLWGKIDLLRFDGWSAMAGVGLIYSFSLP